MIDKEEQLSYYEKWESYKGKQLKISAYLSTNRENFDRHFTSFLKMGFKLNIFLVRFSGHRVCFMGDEHTFEIGGDHIIQITDNMSHEYEVIEKYNDTVFRKTILQFK